MKELYRFRQFLTEGVIKENIMVSPIIMFGGKKYIEDVISSPDDFGFDKDDAEWVKNNILSSPKMVSIQDYMDLDDKWVKQAQIDTSGGGALDHVVDGLKIHVKQELITPEQEKEAMKVVGLSEGDKDHKHTYKQIDPDGTAECTKCGLRNSDPSKTGEKVVKEDYENDYNSSSYDLVKEMTFEKVRDIIQYHKVDPSEVIADLISRFGLSAEFLSEGVIKEDYKNDYANSEEDCTDEMVMEKIKDIIKYHELDPSDVLEEIGQEFGVSFEFGRG